MASEKTTRALRAARRLQRQKGADLPFVVRPTCSVRDHEKDETGTCSGFLITKAGERFPSIELDRAADILKTVEEWGAVWFDEIPLWSDEEVAFEQVQEARRVMPVLVSSCAATTELVPFYTSMAKLLAVADRVRYCRADCDFCGTLNAATRSVCLAVKDGLTLVGGEETYRPACPACWTKWENGNESLRLHMLSACAV